jgi:hypothetical protein
MWGEGEKRSNCWFLSISLHKKPLSFHLIVEDFDRSNSWHEDKIRRDVWCHFSATVQSVSPCYGICCCRVSSICRIPLRNKFFNYNLFFFWNSRSG